MARQHMHNRRASRGSTGGGASWISYSDMMAALLLIFVLILSYSLYQYFTMLEAKTKELDEQAAALILAQNELEDNRQTLIILQGDLETKQLILDEQQQTLDEQNAALVLAKNELEASRQTLIILQGSLEAKQSELDAATARLESQQLALNQQALKIDQLVGVRTTIIRELSSALASSRLRASVDPVTGGIQLDSAVFFETGKSAIKEEGKQLLNTFIPLYLSVLLSDEYSDYLGQIIIEGHTDSTGTYDNNLKLSQERALQVALYCLNMPSLTPAQRLKLQSILTATGRSEADLKYDAYGNEDPEASRRVEFKFSLKDAEMIEEMNRILQDN